MTDVADIPVPPAPDPLAARPQAQEHPANATAAAKPRDIPGDLWGGLAAMLVALPSAIAFGVTIYAPMGPHQAAHGAVAGILGAMALGLVAASFGGSQRLITAPCAPAAAVLSALAITYTQQGMAVETVLLLLALIGMLAGLFQVGMGLIGVGRLIKFIPFPVVSGYLSGVGLIIIGSQIPKLLGAPSGTHLLQALTAPQQWSWPSLVVGAVVMATMWLTPKVTTVVPAAIVALLAGVGTYLGLGGVDTALMHTEANALLVGPLGVGDAGLFDAMSHQWRALGHLGLDAVVQVLVPALTLAVLLSIDTLKTCVVVDAMTSSSHDSNRELIGQGLANVASGMVGGIAGAGTMGATMINISSGGHSRLSGVMAGAFSLAAFLLLAPLIAWVPVGALAAILIVIGVRMIDRRSLKFFFSPATRLDFGVIVVVIAVALFGNLIAASGVGVALSILLFIREQTRSSVIRNRIEGDEVFSKRMRNLRGGADGLKDLGSMVVFELQGSLFFGTASQLHAALEPETERRRYVILSMRRVQSLDVTATHVLEQIKDRLEENNAYLVFCDIPKGLPSGLKMKRFLRDTGVVRPTNKAFAFRQLDEALEWVEGLELLEGRNVEADQQPVDLADMPLFANASPDALDALHDLVTLRFVKAEGKVFTAGKNDTDLLFIRRGTVKVMLPIRAKESHHLATVGRGGVIGSLGFLETDAHAVSAVALTDTEVYVLTREHYQQLTQSHPTLAFAILEQAARELSHHLRVTMGEVQALRG